MVRFFEGVAGISVVLLILRGELGFNITLTVRFVQTTEVDVRLIGVRVDCSFTKDSVEFPVSIESVAEFVQVITYL